MLERAKVQESAILIERTNNSEVNTMKRNQLAQGDVLLIPLERVEGELSEVPREPQGCVLAYGEATGHTHRIEEPGARLFKPATTCSFFMEGGEPLSVDLRGLGVNVLQVEQPVKLLHDEHAPHEIQPGTYLVIRQRERSLLDWRPVSD
jgi:hypothetical protein